MAEVDDNFAEFLRAQQTLELLQAQNKLSLLQQDMGKSGDPIILQRDVLTQIVNNHINNFFSDRALFLLH